MSNTLHASIRTIVCRDTVTYCVSSMTPFGNTTSGKSPLHMSWCNCTRKDTIMHLSLQAWCVLVMWIVGLLWATGLLEDLCRCFHLRWLKIKAIRTIDRILLQME